MTRQPLCHFLAFPIPIPVLCSVPDFLYPILPFLFFGMRNVCPSFRLYISVLVILFSPGFGFITFEKPGPAAKVCGIQFHDLKKKRVREY